MIVTLLNKIRAVEEIGLRFHASRGSMNVGERELPLRESYFEKIPKD